MILVRSFAVGLACGFRSTAGPAVTLGAVDSPWSGIASAAAVGELIVDKLPIAPARTIPPSLVVRAAAGALCARTLARRSGNDQIPAACAGIVGAVGASFGGYWARRTIVRTIALPDFAVALAEDAIAFALARAANRAMPAS